jgi:hypothetical protein
LLRLVCSKSGRDAVLDEINESKENAADLDAIHVLLNKEIEGGISYPQEHVLSKTEFLSCACEAHLGHARVLHTS